ncbi:MAG: hypothetical protein ACLRX3_00080 [Subdoligranulum sp.]
MLILAKYFLFLFTVLYKDTFHIIPAQNAADDTSNNNNTFAALLQRGAAPAHGKTAKQKPAGCADRRVGEENRGRNVFYTEKIHQGCAGLDFMLL